MTDIRAEPLSVDEVRAAVAEPAAGAVAIFVGTVRDHDHGQPVAALSYSAHPSAQDEMARIAEKVATSHQILGLAIAHRTGDLEIGDLAVVAAVSAAHRDEAFAACRELIEEVKASVPIWKHQSFTSGDSEWVNSA